MEPMKIVVTGGAGFIGFHVVQGLVRMGHSVVIVDNYATGVRENIPGNVPVVEADIRDRERIREVFSRERPKAVIHLAAQMNVRRSLAQPSLDAEVNVLGSLHVFQASMECGARRIIFASSGGAIYGDQQTYPCRETDLPQPSSPYGIAKATVEQYGRHFSERTGFDFVALRLANVYGPRQNPEGEAGVVALFLRELVIGRRPVIFGDGEQTRDFIWIGDVARAFFGALGCPPGIYNIGSGKEIGINALYQHLRILTGTCGDPGRLPSIPGEVRRNALSFLRASQVLGWRPQMDLAEGLERTLEFFRDVLRGHMAPIEGSLARVKRSPERGRSGARLEENAILKPFKPSAGS